jgi:hypothetical protein
LRRIDVRLDLVDGANGRGVGNGETGPENPSRKSCAQSADQGQRAHGAIPLAPASHPGESYADATCH